MSRAPKVVFMVAAGEHSDYHVCGIFEGEPSAIRYADAIRGEKSWHAEPHVTAMELGDQHGDEWPWRVTMTQDGQTKECRTCGADEPPDGVALGLRPRYVRLADSQYEYAVELVTWMVARDAEHAIKIANERRAALLAANLWPDAARLLRTPYWYRMTKTGFERVEHRPSLW